MWVLKCPTTRIVEKVEPTEGGVREKTPLTKELLQELHLVKGLSTREMAKETRVGQTTVYRHMKKEGIQIRSEREGRRLRIQHRLERACQHIRPDVRELIKKLERDPSVERTKDGRIKVRSLPPEVRERVKGEALRLRGEGGWGAKIVARALKVSDGAVVKWFHPCPEARRESVLRWQHKHREELSERRRRKMEEAKMDLIAEFGGRCQRCGEAADAIAMDFHEFEKAKEDRRKGFWKGPLGRLWMRSRKTKRREEALELIHKKAMLLDVKCHREITAKERRLGRHLSREEILESPIYFLR